MKRTTAVAVALVLLAGVGFAGYWAYGKFLADRDLASFFPPEARLYVEFDGRSMDAERRRALESYLDWVKERIGGSGELPPLEKLRGRLGFALYGSAKLQGMVPGFLLVVETSKEAAAALDVRFEGIMEGAEMSTREKDGWEIVEWKRAGPMNSSVQVALARRGGMRILSTSTSLLEDGLALAADAKRPSLASSESFRGAFADPAFAARGLGRATGVRRVLSSAGGPVQRVFLDLQGLVNDVHPLLTMVGGEAYAELKRNLLDKIGALATVSAPEGSNGRAVTIVRFRDRPEWFASLASARLQWPEAFVESSDFSMTFALPEKWHETLGKLLRRAIEASRKSSMGTVDGTMGALNAALCMYFADHQEFPAAAEATAVGAIGIVPTYMATEPRTPWDAPYLYEGGPDTYVLSVEMAGEALVWYSSATGRLERADGADSRIAAASGLSPDRMVAVLGSIAEIAFTGRMKQGFPPEYDFSVGVRTREAEAAAEVVKIFEALSIGPHGARRPASRISGAWALFGETRAIEALGEVPAFSGDAGVFHRARSVFDLARVLPESARAGMPEAHAWTSRSTGVVEGEALVHDSLVEPDAVPPLLGAILAVLYTADVPKPRR